MSVYAIGDTHLSFSTDKPMDIFKGWDNYAQRLENNWQRLVANDDTVIINGDISWAMGLEQAEKDLEFLNNLNGTKIISVLNTTNNYPILGSLYSLLSLPFQLNNLLT